MTFQTHEVLNQVPVLENYDTVQHPVYGEFLTSVGAGTALDEIHAFGRLAGSAHVRQLGDLVEVHQPVLHTHDRNGYRIDKVEYSPAYHELMSTAIGNGLGGTPWVENRDHAHLLRAVKFSAWQSSDVGHTCPVTMTYAAVPALQADSELAAMYVPGLSNGKYDSAFVTPSAKDGLIAGMSMTEKQGGSDVRANTTYAVPQPDGTYRITGHKWFTSAPMSDILLTLAQTPAGQTCFILPRVLPDGSRNAISLQRLKNKLGNKSNASSEIEYHEAIGWRLGEEGRGVRTIIEMVNMTRLDVSMTSAALMMIGLTRASHHARHRDAFGATLIDKPLMRNVLADLAVEAESSTLAGMWLAHLTDRVHQGDQEAALLRRLSLPATKFYVCKRAPSHTAETLECLGGNGYVEDSGMPRLYREAPLGSIWEGSGNVAALDVLRALARSPEAFDLLNDRFESQRGADGRFDEFTRDLKNRLGSADDLEFDARVLVGDLALAIQASVLLEHGNSSVTDVFLQTRLSRQWGTTYGTLPSTAGVDEILERTLTTTY